MQFFIKPPIDNSKSLINSGFQNDEFPGKPRILFVGWANSSHTHAWIDLVKNDFNVRLYSLPAGIPPDSWSVKTYVTQSTPLRLDRRNRRKLYPGNTWDRDIRNPIVRFVHGPSIDAPRLGLARVVKSWKPHIVHALGLEPAGRFVLQTKTHFGLQEGVNWVLQLRGGSDLALSHLDERYTSALRKELSGFDHIITDNLRNVEIARGLGLSPDGFAAIVPVPGTGGIDIEAMRALRIDPPESRTDIVWPKAYECEWSKALPVFEALKICQRKLAGRKVHLLAVNEEVVRWFNALPVDVRKQCHLQERIPRDDFFALLGRCRIMLAPSLVDGVPNSLYEAMALGAFPIVSPLSTITPVVRAVDNVLFARNLYPGEIADALARAIEDDKLVEAASLNNMNRVVQLADRKAIRQSVVEFYKEIQ